MHMIQFTDKIFDTLPVKDRQAEPWNKAISALAAAFEHFNARRAEELLKNLEKELCYERILENEDSFFIHQPIFVVLKRKIASLYANSNDLPRANIVSQRAVTQSLDIVGFECDSSLFAPDDNLAETNIHNALLALTSYGAIKHLLDSKSRSNSGKAAKKKSKSPQCVLPDEEFDLETESFSYLMRGAFEYALLLIDSDMGTFNCFCQFLRDSLLFLAQDNVEKESLVFQELRALRLKLMEHFEENKETQDEISEALSHMVKEKQIAA